MLNLKAASRLRHDAWVALAGGAFLLIWDISGADLVVTRCFASADGFRWRESWWTSTLLHQGGRVAAGIVLALLVLGCIRPIVRGPARGERVCALVSTLVALALVPALKFLTATSCPWDLAEFGGNASHVSHWRLDRADGGPGHCFPSGHAVAAFAFFSVYFLLRSTRPLAAHRCLAAVCVMGMLIGGAQVVRGAHHVSHILWSAWLCWLICASLAAHFEKARSDRRRAQGT